MPATPAQTTSIAIPPDSAERVDLGGLGIVWKIDGDHTGERFSSSITRSPRAPSPPRSTCTRARTSTPTW